jgi:hypothetical protein
MKDINIDPDGLSKGGGSLQKLGGELESGGSKLEQAGQRMAQHAARDKSGIGKVLMEAFGRGTQVAGDVIKEGGRVVKKSGQHLHESGQAHVENDHRGRQRFDKIKPEDKTPHPKGGRSGPGRGGKGGAGAPPHQPPNPPGGGGGGPHGGGTGRNLPPSWHEENKKHFTPKEQQELQHAMRKLSEEPTDRGVPGSGRLTQHERELMARAQKHVTIDPDTPMQKVITDKAHHGYLNPERDANGVPTKPPMVGGFVARQQDATHLNTPDAIVQGNRLDYANTPYHQGMQKVHVVEFPAGDPNHYKTPLGAPVASDHGALPTDPSVRHTSDRMHDAADTVGLDPNSHTRQNNSWPYTGAGVTADPNGIPERVKDWQEFPDGSRMVEYDPAGNRVVTHTYDQRTREWIPVP